MAGYDSNINASTEDDLSLLLGLPPGSVNSSTPQEDAFTSLAGNLSYAQPLSPQSNLSVGLNLNHRENSSGDLPKTLGGLNLDYSHRSESNTLQLGLMANQFRLENRDYRDMIGLTSSIRLALGPRSAASVFAQLSDLSYPDNPVKDSLLVLAGLNVQHQFSGDFRPVLTAGVTVGSEKAQNDGLSGALQNTERDIIGARALSSSLDEGRSILRE